MSTTRPRPCVVVKSLPELLSRWPFHFILTLSPVVNAYPDSVLLLEVKRLQSAAANEMNSVSLPAHHQQWHSADIKYCFSNFQVFQYGC